MLKPDKLKDTVGNDAMTLKAFFSYMRKSLRNRAQSLHKKFYRRLQKELQGGITDNIGVMNDFYPSDYFWLSMGRSVYCFDSEDIVMQLIGLPETHVQALLLNVVENIPDRQIAKLYGVSERTIRQWRSETIKSLKKYIGTLEREENEKDNEL